MSTFTTLLGRFAAVAALAVATLAPAQAGTLDPLTPDNSALLMVDYQPQFVFSVQSMPVDQLINNAEGLTKAARVFEVPTFYATIGADSFGGPFFRQLSEARPELVPYDRSVIDPLRHAPLVEAIAATGHRKLLVAGLWTDSCVTLPVLNALKQGYEVYVVVDASADASKQSHEMAVQRMVQAGAVPVTWLAVMLEWQGDWANRATGAQVMSIAQQHGGAWGQGIDYFQTMVRPGR